MGAREVAAGAQWLDENFPGWEREIDLGTLNIRSCRDCVCGQALRSYVLRGPRSYDDSGFGKAAELLDRQLPHNYQEILSAFQVSGTPGETDKNEALWRELIKERFNTGNLSDIGED